MPVSLKKSNENVFTKGVVELYADRVVLKIPHGFSLATLVSPLPPTFPDVQMVEMTESIPFSSITSISSRVKGGFLSRNVNVEMRTDKGVTWNITAPSRILDALQNAFEAWKHSGPD
ncbi:MAG TPA: hypothetical protein VGS11_04670 [Candidatus Bathyarchaeia archaeon]|nr:hypothetical protein [Candidatus Bathyarchaeia archaeon]